MKTNREFVSRVIGELRTLSKDSHISRRLVLSTGKDKARFLMAQKLDEMTLFREDGIISNIECFELENVPSISCGVMEFKLCKSVMRSVKEIPEGLFGKNGAGILSVTNIDGSDIFRYISPREFINLSKRKYVLSKDKYYTIKDRKIVLPDSEVEVVTLSMFALDKSQLDEVSSCCDEQAKCKTVWDYEFVCPDRFYDLVARDTLQELASIYRTSIVDENPNMDENQKSQTTA